MKLKRLESSRPSGGRVARSRPPDHPVQPSASDGGGNEKVSRGSGEGCSTHLECWSKSPQSQDQVRVARLEVYVESAVRGSRAARQLVEDWSTCSSSQPATSGRACRAPLNCQIPTENSRLRAAARHYGAAPRGIWAAMSPSPVFQRGGATLCTARQRRGRSQRPLQPFFRAGSLYLP